MDQVHKIETGDQMKNFMNGISENIKDDSTRMMLNKMMGVINIDDSMAQMMKKTFEIHRNGVSQNKTTEEMAMELLHEVRKSEEERAETLN